MNAQRAREVFGGQTSQRRQTGGTTQPAAKKKTVHVVPESVEMSPEDAMWAELEAAMVYWRDLIKLKISQGEDIGDDHPLVDKLREAASNYQKKLEEGLSMEQIVELNQNLDAAQKKAVAPKKSAK